MTPTRTTSITYGSYGSCTTLAQLPCQIVTPGVTTTFTYDMNNNVSTRTDTDTTTGSTPYSTSGNTRTWTYTWHTSGANVGLLASVQDPNTNTTSFGYPGSGAANTGLLTSISLPTTGSISHTTTFGYPSTGNTNLPQTITDPNGVQTTLTYDNRLNLSQSQLCTSGCSTGTPTYTTAYLHDNANNLIKVTLPDNSYLQYGYDSANRLTTITNILGESIQYTLDALGDRLTSTIYNASSSPTRKRSATFDNLGRITTDNAWISSPSSTSCTTSICNTTVYTYDPNSNVLTIEDPRAYAAGATYKTARTYDALNRLHTTTDRVSTTNITTINYDAHDAITSVQDALGHTTSYTRDGFERAIAQISPDSGTSVYHYDFNGNLTQKIDGAGYVTNRTFDALNRELYRCFPSSYSVTGCSSHYSAYDVAKQYDQSGSYFGYGIGHLTTMYDTAQAVTMTYDERGNDLWDEHYLGMYTFIAGFTYDRANRLVGTVNPDGWGIVWNRDYAGQVVGIGSWAPGASGPVDLAGDVNGTSSAYIMHEPFGPVTSIPFHNGITRTNTYDLDYRLTNSTDQTSGSMPTPFLNLTYGYDANSNVNAITDGVYPVNTQCGITYDNNDELTAAMTGTTCTGGASGGYGSLAWNWDANGNPTSDTDNGTYSYTSGTNKLASTTTSGLGFIFNGAGALTTLNQWGSLLWSYGVTPSEQQLSATYTGTSSPVVDYEYDGFGQRFSKSTTVSTGYFYGPAGQLFEEVNSYTTLSTDYAYLDPSNPREAFYPVGMLAVYGSGTSSTGTPYYIHADRIGTPEVVTDGTPSAQWNTTYTPFGATTPYNPSGITMNLRLPGMYDDTQQTGYYHNGAREYSSLTGRYIQADPTGLNGGTNPYQYANSNPFRLTDVYGLNPNCAFALIGTAAGAIWDNTSMLLENPDYVSQWHPGDAQFLELGLLTGGGSLWLDGALVFAAEADDTVTVGRWMSDYELDYMQQNGVMLESRNFGVSGVIYPANPQGYQAAPSGDQYVEFDIPSSSVTTGTGRGWVYGPNSIIGRGQGVTQMPPVTNIRPFPNE